MSMTEMKRPLQNYDVMLTKINKRLADDPKLKYLAVGPGLDGLCLEEGFCLVDWTARYGEVVLKHFRRFPTFDDIVDFIEDPEQWGGEQQQ
jgi:hypothetical protein